MLEYLSIKLKNINVKLFNKTRFLFQHESCEYLHSLNKIGPNGLNESVCNSKQKWNHYECRCECKELSNCGSCKDDCKGYPSILNCECNKSCKIDNYLNIRNCSC